MLDHKPTIRIMSATEAKNKFGAMLKQAYGADEHVIVEKGGIPVVAIIPIAAYRHSIGLPSALEPEMEDHLAREQRRAEASKHLGELLKKIHARMPEVDEAEVDREVAEAIRAVRAKQPKKTAVAERRAKYQAARRSSKGKKQR